MASRALRVASASAASASSCMRSAAPTAARTLVLALLREACPAIAISTATAAAFNA